jgi:hypothetical protein
MMGRWESQSVVLWVDGSDELGQDIKDEGVQGYYISRHGRLESHCSALRSRQRP